MKRGFVALFLSVVVQLFCLLAIGQQIYTGSEFNPHEFKSGSFFSFIWNTENPSEIYICPGVGCLDSNGQELSDSDTIPRYRGHYKIAVLQNLISDGIPDDQVVESKYRGGGLSFDSHGVLKIFHKSRSMNGFDYGDGDLDPKLIPTIEAQLKIFEQQHWRNRSCGSAVAG